jgi:hypothetical protein
MEHNPGWKADRYYASQEIPRILCNLGVQYCVYSSLLMGLTLRSIQVTTSNPVSLRFVLILPSGVRLGP